jgi:hypothetical protein
MIVIPWRVRGRDTLRIANLHVVARQWRDHGYAPLIVGDGRSGQAPFNRSAAYNLAVSMCPTTEVFVFAESDMLIDLPQVKQAITLAADEPGLVVPFTQYRYLSAKDSVEVRGGVDPHNCDPESIMDNGESVGALNVVSRETVDLTGGFDEGFRGSWHDDIAMEKAFRICAGPTRWIDGPAFHLYHLPGWTGDHLTDEDRAATRANKERWDLYQAADTAEELRQLVTGSRQAVV